MQENDDVESFYRPLVNAYRRLITHPKTPDLLRAALFLGATPLVLVPVPVRHFILFRERNAITRKVAEGLPKDVQKFQSGMDD